MTARAPRRLLADVLTQVLTTALMLAVLAPVLRLAGWASAVAFLAGVPLVRRLCRARVAAIDRLTSQLDAR